MAQSHKQENNCNDKKCPFHGSTRLRGLTLEGTIIKIDTHRTATFEKSRRFYVKKYERFERRRTRLHVHNPSCINAKKGDRVKIMECKPLSKTKKFVIIKKLGYDVLFQQKEEALEEAKVKTKKKEEEAKSDKTNKKPESKVKTQVENATS